MLISLLKRRAAALLAPVLAPLRATLVTTLLAATAPIANAQPAATIAPVGAVGKGRDHALLVPGLGQRAADMAPLADALALRFNVHAATLAGFGDEPAMNATGRWPDRAAAALTEYARGLDGGRVLVIGFGLGGTLACLTLASDTVDGVVTIDGLVAPSAPDMPVDLDPQDRPAWVDDHIRPAINAVPAERWTSLLREHTEQAWSGLPDAATVAARVAAVPPHVTQRYYLEWLMLDARPLLERRPGRAMAIVPASDEREARDADAQRAFWTQHLGAQQAVTIIGDRPCPHLRQPGAVAEAIAAFAAGLAPGSVAP